MVFITVQNLVAIALVVLMIQKFKYFVRFALQCLFMPFLAVFGVTIWDNENFLNSYPLGLRNAVTQN